MVDEKIVKKSKSKSKISSRFQNIFLPHAIEAGIFIILFLPIFVNKNFIFPFIFPKTILFRLIIEVCLALYLALIILDKRYRPKMSISLGLLVAFISIMIVTSLLGVDWYHSFWSSLERSEGIITWLHLLAFFIILSGINRTKQDWLKLFKIVIIVSWIQAVYALGQILQLEYVVRIYGSRIIGSIGNASFLASYLIFTIFIAGYLLTQKPSLKAKISYIAITIINLYLLWQTETRGAILAMFAGFLLVLLLNVIFARKKLFKVGSIVLLIVIGVLIVFTIINKNHPWLANQGGALSRIAGISFTEPSTINRLRVWSIGWESFSQQPLTGWGWENFNAAFNKNFDPKLARDVGSHPWFDRAHNVIVEVAVTTGIFGLIFYLAIFAWAIIRLLRQKMSKPIFNANLVLVILLIVYFLQNIFVFDTLNTYLLFFMLLAFIQFETSSPKQEKEQEPTRINFSQSKKLNQKGLILSGIFILLLTPVAYYYNVRPALANYYIIQAIKDKGEDNASEVALKMFDGFNKAFKYSPPNERALRFIMVQHTRDLLSFSGITPETIPLTEFVIAEMEKSLIVAPTYIQDKLILIELYVAARDHKDEYLVRANELALQTLEEAPLRYQIYTSLGRLYMSPEKYEQGIEYFIQATKLNEDFAEAHWNLAISYLLGNHMEQAQKSFDKANELGFNVYAYQNIEKILNAFQDAGNIVGAIDFLETLAVRFPERTPIQERANQLREAYEQILSSQ